MTVRFSGGARISSAVAAFALLIGGQSVSHGERAGANLARLTASGSSAKKSAHSAGRPATANRAAVTRRAKPSKAKPVELAIGSMAPEISVKSLDGRTTRLSELRGRIVLLDFWATWCAPCRHTLPETQALHRAYSAKGLTVLAISPETRGKVTPFLKHFKFTFPAFLDQRLATTKSYQIEGLPTVAVIDRSGRLSSYIVGVITPDVIHTALRKAGLPVN